MEGICSVRDCYRSRSLLPRRTLLFQCGVVKPTCNACWVQWKRLHEHCDEVPPIPNDMNYYGLYKKRCDAEKKLLCAICHGLTEDTPHMMCEHVEPSLCAHTVHLACMGLASEPAKYFCKYHEGEADTLEGYSFGGSHPGLESEWWYHKMIPVSAANAPSSTSNSTQDQLGMLHRTSSLEWLHQRNSELYPPALEHDALVELPPRNFNPLLTEVNAEQPWPSVPNYVAGQAVAPWEVPDPFVQGGEQSHLDSVAAQDESNLFWTETALVQSGIYMLDGTYDSQHSMHYY